MRSVLDDTLMINAGTRVDDNIFTELYARIYDCSSHNYAARTDDSVISNYCLGMNRSN